MGQGLAMMETFQLLNDMSLPILPSLSSGAAASCNYSSYPTQPKYGITLHLIWLEPAQVYLWTLT